MDLQLSEGPLQHTTLKAVVALSQRNTIGGSHRGRYAVRVMKRDAERESWKAKGGERDVVRERRREERDASANITGMVLHPVAADIPNAGRGLAVCLVSSCET
jgi:hypothetical protein